MICPDCSRFSIHHALLWVGWLILAAFIGLTFWQGLRQQEQSYRDRSARQPVMKFMGTTVVHYYDHGEWIITPEKQPAISEVFKKGGKK